MKDEYINLAYNEPQKYSFRELFTLKDGGQIYIDYKFKSVDDKFEETVKQDDVLAAENYMDKYFKSKEIEQRDILFVFAGQVGCSDSLYVKNIIKDAYNNRDFDIVMISWRG